MGEGGGFFVSAFPRLPQTFCAIQNNSCLYQKHIKELYYDKNSAYFSGSDRFHFGKEKQARRPAAGNAEGGGARNKGRAVNKGVTLLSTLK
jgi:hypothetical protein